MRVIIKNIFSTEYDIILSIHLFLHPSIHFLYLLILVDVTGELEHAPSMRCREKLWTGSLCNKELKHTHIYTHMHTHTHT